MKKRLENFITGTSFQPWPGYAFTHLQEAYTEVLDALAKARVGITYDPTKAYILYGCFLSNSFTDSTISEGAIFFNGEVYLSPAQIIPISAGTLLANIATRYSDPVGQTEYTDGTINQDCQILTVGYSYGTSGTGTIANFSDLLSDRFTISGAVAAAGWANVGSPYNPIAYKINGNEVQMSGTIAGTVISAPFNIIDLPAIATPSNTAIIPCILNFSGVLEPSLMLIAQGTGVVSIPNCSGTGACIVYFDSISYRLR